MRSQYFPEPECMARLAEWTSAYVYLSSIVSPWNSMSCFLVTARNCHRISWTSSGRKYCWLVRWSCITVYCIGQTELIPHATRDWSTSNYAVDLFRILVFTWCSETISLSTDVSWPIRFFKTNSHGLSHDTHIHYQSAAWRRRCDSRTEGMPRAYGSGK